MPSLLARLVKLGVRAQIKRRPTDGLALVAHLRKALGRPAFPTVVPAGVSLGHFAADGVEGEVVSVATPKEAVLYLHGGGYVAGHPRVYRNLAGVFASGLAAEVIMPRYRLAPEAPFPAAVHDALAAYAYVRARGYAPEHISVVGDSAGGGLALALLLALRDRGVPPPRCGVMFSPFADMTLSAQSIVDNDASCDMFTSALIHAGRGLYARVDQARDPYASPVFGDFRGLPPLFVTVSEAECLRDDSYGVRARAREAGVPIELVSSPDLMHVWPIFAPHMPEARREAERAIAFIRRHAPAN